jgi:hypothetical protein
MTIDNKKPFECHERRHMKPHVFVTYDAMRACCGDKRPFIFYGGAVKLANLNNRSPEQERQALAELEKDGWIVSQNPPNADGRKQRRRWHGKLVGDEYRVFNHDEYMAANSGCCPPVKYDERTGRPLAPGRAARGLERANVRKLLAPNIQFSGGLGDQLLDAIADVIHSKKVSGNAPVQATSTDPPVQVESTSTDPSEQTTTDAPVEASTDPPVQVESTSTDPSEQTTTDAPVEASTDPPVQDHYRRTCNKPYSQPDKEPTNQPNLPAPETTSGAAHGRLAGWIKKNFTTMGRPKGKAKELLDRLVAEHGEAVVIRVLNSFLNRPEGFGGLNQPWLVFAKEADLYVGQVIQEERTKEADDVAQRHAGEQMKAEILAKLDALIPPLSEAERASVQQRVARAELLTNGLEYSISWQDLADSHTGLISDVVDKRRKLAEAEEAKFWTGKIEDFL